MTSTLDELRLQWLPEIERRLATSCPGPGLVARMGRYHLATGGKRFRALLPLWVCANLGGEPEDALEFGVGLELLHNATLIHDDIQDGDTHRRGKPTVWSHWGTSQAINAGDALIFQALHHLALAPAGSHVVPLVCETMNRLIDGQAMDMQLHLPEGDPDRITPSLDAYMEMARRKTGSLFALCCQLGVCAARMEAQWQLQAAEFGTFVGLAFQVADDLLELVGDKGRAPGSDLMTGKMSFPVLWAYEHAGARDLALLRRVMHCGREATTPEMLLEALAVLRRSAAIDATKEWLRGAQREAQAHAMARVMPGVVDRLVVSMGRPIFDSCPQQKELHHEAQ